MDEKRELPSDLPSDFLTEHDGLIPKPGETIHVMDGQIVSRGPTRAPDRQYVEPVAKVERNDDPMNTESTEHGDHNVGRKLILAHEGSPEKELEITWWAVDSSGHAYGHYSAKDTKGLVHTVGRSDFSDGQARWLRNHARDCDGKPCECGANPPPKLPVWKAFHRGWGQAKMSPEYDKEVWKELEREILALIYPHP